MNNDTKNIRILLIEDSPADTKALEMDLIEKSDHQFSVLCTKTLSEGIKSIGHDQFDVVLLDLELPDSHGLQTLFRFLPQAAGVPVLALTGCYDERVGLEAVQAGAQDYLVKDNLSPSTLSRAVRYAIERKRSEEEILRAQQELKKSNTDLLRKQEELQAFYHNVSHEVKTPLAAAREFVSLVLEGFAGPINEMQREYLDIALESCNRMRLCVDDLFDAARLETGKISMDLSPGSIGSVIKRLIAVFTPAAKQKNVRLRSRISKNIPKIPLDEHRIAQVITNLLNNALKFTSAGGEVVISAKFIQLNSGFVEVKVCDSGRGIPASDLPYIFDRLSQAKSADGAHTAGMGLGLHISRDLVQLHGGTIWAESEEGKGAVFTFRLPVAMSSKPSVLVVEDDSALRAYLQELLEQAGYTAITAHNGIQAIAALDHEIPDVIVLDLGMDEMDGAATMKEIRNRWDDIPIIIFTGYPDGYLMSRALEYSPFTMLVKPCESSRFLETVRNVARPPMRQNAVPIRPNFSRS